jgi:hypothetical protein
MKKLAFFVAVFLVAFTSSISAQRGQNDNHRDRTEYRDDNGPYSNNKGPNSRFKKGKNRKDVHAKHHRKMHRRAANHKRNNSCAPRDPRNNRRGVY